MTQTDILSSEQEDLRLLRESARTLFERAGGSDRARQLRDAGSGFDPEMVRELAEAGVFGVAVPEDQGGLGMGLAAGGVIAEEVGRVIAPEPVVLTIGLSLGLLRRLCPDHPKMAQLIGGEISLAVAWQERGPDGAPADATCRYADGKLTGGKAWVVGAIGSHGFLVVAEQDDGPVLVLAEADAQGLVIDKRTQADGSSLGELSFSGTPAVELARGGAVPTALAEAVADATALAAAELVGLSERAFEITLDYIKTREQFDKPIGSFQVIQHRAVELNVMCEVAQAGVREALAQMDSETDPKVRAPIASRAKARAVTAAKRITRDAIQLHGAVGYTDEFDIGLYLNRALVLSAWLGDDAYHRRIWFEAREAEGAAQ
ncbi:Acyl-CoA dehydrogenase [Thalassococcus halodurans]|uniref:Acyl-CoA dehydrogenase n=1 Tax=Thalassococcus halodurans TaxID=373675 RepID=A0A1H6B5W3_9RHOB|nr:acyl-CoA dehydrogenase family protein [Thalassococcus halodurans]SEG55506.1 Acyl-CoA dehydrogenase [Thalassococcus halodurans]